MPEMCLLPAAGSTPCQPFHHHKLHVASRPPTRQMAGSPVTTLIAVHMYVLNHFNSPKTSVPHRQYARTKPLIQGTAPAPAPPTAPPTRCIRRRPVNSLTAKASNTPALRHQQQYTVPYLQTGQLYHNDDGPRTQTTTSSRLPQPASSCLSSNRSSAAPTIAAFLAAVPLALKAAEEQGVAMALATGRVTLEVLTENFGALAPLYVLYASWRQP